ncbi:MAG TPA: 23S rRNA (pseudouridine(1915)-N(3))-methyltransferase RlmH [Terriglobales bacterium]|nr:23S rRNA (pseudouridine(1915)-N(3))-methyltransferase RlmH [Terriglobales bacterium]
MNVHIYAVGKLSEPWWREAAAEYVKRCGRWCKLTVTELPESRLPKSPSAGDTQRAVSEEGSAMLAKLPAKAFVVGLFIEGRQMSSEQLAGALDAAMTAGKSDLVFLVGGSHGMSKEVENACDLTLSFSKMTFPHQLARVMLCEQIYRAFTILNGQEYHK